jgi:hypothetical protein
MWIFLMFGFPLILVAIDFVYVMLSGKRLFHPMLIFFLELIVIFFYPLIFLTLLDDKTNDCCTASTAFSPDHRATIIFLIAVCIIGYAASRFKDSIISPISEVLINSILLIGIVLNVFIAMHINAEFWVFGNLPIILLFVIELIDNHKKAIVFVSKNCEAKNRFERIALKILDSNFLFKIPLLMVLALPILVLITSFLMLFGQKPDSIIRAFTDTYKHGFSQLDYMCDNVHCGGHFLCSVAANGHESIVVPKRYGERRGKRIICNRQLLVANAFEELIEERAPEIHAFIRGNYNKVGNVIHRYYDIFNLKIVSDIVYFFMKPLEWIFLIILYSFDRNPENRIAKQYLKSKDRMEIEKKLKINIL